MGLGVCESKWKNDTQFAQSVVLQFARSWYQCSALESRTRTTSYATHYTIHILLLVCRTYLTPTRFNFISFCSNFINFTWHHLFCHLIRSPLIDRTHWLSIQFVHASRFLLNVCYNWNISNATFHQGLCHDAMRTILLCLLSGRCWRTRSPTSGKALIFDLIILVNFIR